jgi:DNA-binding NarL/FixJ family response regulator
MLAMAYAISVPEITPLETPQRLKVLAVDNSRMNSQLLASALEREPCFQIITRAADVSIISTAAIERPNVVLVSSELDGDPKGGFEIARQIRPETRVIMLLDRSERHLVVESFRAGARGVFCRSESLSSLAKCVLRVSQGQVWANSQEIKYLLDALGEAMPMRVVNAQGAAILSRREQEVVRCVAEGLSNREISQRLGLTEHTVKNYLFRIFDKLGVSKRVEVVLYAYSLSGTAGDLPPIETIPSIARNAVVAMGSCQNEIAAV